MKFLLFVILSFFPYLLDAATFTWNTSLDGQSWENAINWSPNTDYPDNAADIAVFPSLVGAPSSLLIYTTGNITLDEMRFTATNGTTYVINLLNDSFILNRFSVPTGALDNRSNIRSGTLQSLNSSTLTLDIVSPGSLPTNRANVNVFPSINEWGARLPMKSTLVSENSSSSNDLPTPNSAALR